MGTRYTIQHVKSAARFELTPEQYRAAFDAVINDPSYTGPQCEGRELVRYTDTVRLARYVD